MAVPSGRASRRAAAGLVATVPAQAAEVVSSNIVGYNKITLQPGLNMLSSQFFTVGANGATLDLTDATNMTGQPSFDENGDAQTTIRFWTGGGYHSLSWAGNLTGENPDMAEEIEEELEVDPATLNNHWLDSSYEVADDELSKGEGFWIYAKNAGSFLLAGEVSPETSFTNNLAVGLNMVSSPWPMEMPLTKIIVTGQPSFDENGDAQTTIRIWTGGGYHSLSWAGNLTEENPDMAEEIEEELEVDPATLNNHWLDSSYEVADDVISIGTSFWIYAKNAGKVIFNK